MAWCLDIDDIESWEYVECPEVYDIEVESNHNYYIYSGKEILAHNSSKSYSIAQLILKFSLEAKYEIDVLRKTTPSLKGSVLKDFVEILNSNKIEYKHNKTENVITILSSKTNINFLSLDDPQKIRGRKRHILWLNEANEFTYEDFKQLIFRTSHKAFLDFNPSDEFHWIYDKVLTRDDCTFIKSTYLDNPFLEPEIIKEIERLKEEDENYWNVYGLGERGVSQEIIYSKWRVGDLDFEPDKVIYGLDFGYQVQTALEKVSIREKKAHIKELIYETHLTNNDLIQRLIDLKVSKKDPIYADAAEPDRIKEIKEAGFNIHPANKSVKAGIDHVKSHELILDREAAGIQREIKHYKNKKDSSGNVIDEPVKYMDHGLDAVRYGMYTDHISEKKVPRARVL